MTPKIKNRLKRLLGYPAFFFAAFGLMLFLTFPYEAIAEIARAQARRSGIELAFDSIGPGFLGVRASGISVRLPKSPEQAAAPEPIVIDRVSLRPSLLPLGVRYAAELFGGTIEGHYGAVGNPQLRLRAKGLNLLRSNAKAAVGLDLDGTLGGAVDLRLDAADSSKTTGRIALLGEGLVINGGTIAHYDLPKVDLGRLEAEVTIEDGKASMSTFQANGKDVEAKLEGEITLAAKATLSPVKLKVQFKPAEDFLNRNSFIKAGLGFAMSKDNRGFYGGNVLGTVGNPRFQAIK